MGQKTGKYPDRSVKTETGAIVKRWKGRIKVALVYPNTYHLGMSSLGFQTVYCLLNSIDHVVCERAFLPDKHDKNTKAIVTVESGQKISSADIVAFSVSYENDYINLLEITKRAGIPLYSAERGAPHPLIIAGGVACFLNPEPIAPFIDCFLIGEAESIIPQFFKTYDPDIHKYDQLKKIVSQVPGAYIPLFYQPAYKADSTLSAIEPVEKDVPLKIKRAYSEKLSGTPACSSVITHDTEFADAFLVEISRGCPHGCRFCSAGYIYRPPRYAALSALKKCVEKGAKRSKKIGLIGAAVSDHPDISQLCHFINQQNIRAAFSSLRADALSGNLIVALANSNTKTATIAPDAGSDKMRRVINKGMTENDIMSAVDNLVTAGIPNVKLYFMVGLPEETDDDVDAIIDLCKKIKKRFLTSSRAKKRIGRITVNINPFVPKPFTPFQWTSMEHQTSLKNKIKKIKQGLKRTANITVRSDNPRKAYIQALLARGDRRVSEVLLNALQNNGNWAKTLKESLIDTDFYVFRERTEKERFPWDMIDHGIKKSYLWKEYKKGREAKPSPPCPLTDCNQCGVCTK